MTFINKTGNQEYKGKKSQFCYQPDRDVWVGFGRGRCNQHAFCEIFYDHTNEGFFMQTFNDAALSTLTIFEIAELMRELGKVVSAKAGEK